MDTGMMKLTVCVIARHGTEAGVPADHAGCPSPAHGRIAAARPPGVGSAQAQTYSHSCQQSLMQKSGACSSQVPGFYPPGRSKGKLTPSQRYSAEYPRSLAQGLRFSAPLSPLTWQLPSNACHADCASGGSALPGAVPITCWLRARWRWGRGWSALCAGDAQLPPAQTLPAHQLPRSWCIAT
jgi:hypothetical protein